MDHVVSGLVKVWNDILVEFMKIFTGEFWAGLEVPRFRSASSLANPISVAWVSRSDQAFTGGSQAPFADMFPGLSVIATSFIFIGTFFCILLFLLGLLLAFLPEGMSQAAEHPGKTVIRFVCAFVLTAYAFNFMTVVTFPVATMFNTLAGETYVTEEEQKKNKKSVFNSVFDPLWENEEKEQADQETENALSPDQFGSNQQLVLKKQNPDLYTESHGDVWSIKIQESSSEEESDDTNRLAAAFIICIMQTALALGFIKLVFELVERYITLCFLYYAAPLAASTIASPGTNQVFVNYMKMIFSEMLVIALNFIFIFMFIYAFNHPGIDDKGTFTSWGQYLLYVALLIAWAKLGTRLDELLSTMGFTAARTGAGLMGAVMAATGTTFLAARGAMSAGRAFGRGSAGFGKGFAAAKAGKSVAGAGLSGMAGAGLAKSLGVGAQARNGLDQALKRSDQLPIKGQEAMRYAMQEGIPTEKAAGGFSISNGKFNALDRNGNTVATYSKAGSLPAGAPKITSANAKWEAPITAQNMNSSYVKTAMAPNVKGFNQTESAGFGAYSGEYNGRKGVMYSNAVYGHVPGADNSVKGFSFVREGAGIKPQMKNIPGYSGGEKA